MKKKLLLASALVSLWGATAQAQTPVSIDRKWDGIVENLFQKHQKADVTTKSTQTSRKGIIISCTDSEAVAEAIVAAGYEAVAITENVVSANVPVNFIRNIADMEEVTYIDGAQKLKATMQTARVTTNADKIQRGTGLETPFTGKGVIVGVIDQGFQYQHIAFLDKNKKSRVLTVWDDYAHKKPTEIIPSTGDFIDANGHATHVTNIAAGSKINDNDYYGMAPDADIIMIPSSFEGNDVLKEAKFIKDYANKEGKPFVINMSFGSQLGPHDGTSTYCQTMNAISEPGGILVAAIGNEGMDVLHTHHVFTADNEKIYIIFEPGDNYINLVDVWGMKTDGKSHLSVKPLVFDRARRTKDFKNKNFWKKCLTESGNIDPNNQKEHYLYTADNLNLQGGNTSLYFGLEITGNKGDEFHSWVNPSFGQIYYPGGQSYLRGDNQYCVGEGAATIPTAIAVASYNSNNGSFVSAIDGNQYSYNLGNCKVNGAVSAFSSRGPYLGKEPKPLVAAPGSLVHSAISRYGNSFNAQDLEIVDIIRTGFQKDYYAVMSGTSMASPAVAGIVALWLQANPELTYEQIKQIIQETAIKDRYTGNKEWNNECGYGKIDAYAGLKKALALAEQSGINDQLNSETPVSIQRVGSQFRILFNNDESYATITLFNAKGIAVQRKQLTDIRRGNETTLSTMGLPAGVYIVNISTTASTASKKMIVK